MVDRDYSASCDIFVMTSDRSEQIEEHVKSVLENAKKVGSVSGTKLLCTAGDEMERDLVVVTSEDGEIVGARKATNETLFDVVRRLVAYAIEKQRYEAGDDYDYAVMVTTTAEVYRNRFQIRIVDDDFSKDVRIVIMVAE